MNRIFILFIACMFSISASAQKKSTAEITGMQLIDKTVQLTVTSSKPFYFGGNVYVIHIGKKDFSLYKQSKENGKGVLTFLIPAEEFNTLTDGDKVWLTYGDTVMNNAEKENNLDVASEKSSRCWKLGKLNKGLLKK